MANILGTAGFLLEWTTYSLEKTGTEITVDFDYNIEQIRERKSVITGAKTQTVTGYHHNFKIILELPTKTDFNTLLAMVPYECDFTPHVDKPALKYDVFIKKFKPVYSKNNFNLDQIEIELQSCVMTQAPTYFVNLSVITSPANEAIDQLTTTAVTYTFNKWIKPETIITDIDNTNCNLYLHTDNVKINCNFEQLNTTEFKLIPVTELGKNQIVHMIVGSTIIAFDEYQGSFAGVDYTFITVPDLGSSIMFISDLYVVSAPTISHVDDTIVIE